jgi:hypothetical protein
VLKLAEDKTITVEGVVVVQKDADVESGIGETMDPHSPRAREV